MLTLRPLSTIHNFFTRTKTRAVVTASSLVGYFVSGVMSQSSVYGPDDGPYGKTPNSNPTTIDNTFTCFDPQNWADYPCGLHCFSSAMQNGLISLLNTACGIIDIGTCKFAEFEIFFERKYGNGVFGGYKCDLSCYNDLTAGSNDNSTCILNTLTKNVPDGFGTSNDYIATACIAGAVAVFLFPVTLWAAQSVRRKCQQASLEAREARITENLATESSRLYPL